MIKVIVNGIREFLGVRETPSHIFQEATKEVMKKMLSEQEKRIREAEIMKVDLTYRNTLRRWSAQLGYSAAQVAETNDALRKMDEIVWRKTTCPWCGVKIEPDDRKNGFHWRCGGWL